MSFPSSGPVSAVNPSTEKAHQSQRSILKNGKATAFTTHQIFITVNEG